MVRTFAARHRSPAWMRTATAAPTGIDRTIPRAGRSIAGMFAAPRPGRAIARMRAPARQPLVGTVRSAAAPPRVIRRARRKSLVGTTAITGRKPLVGMTSQGRDQSEIRLRHAFLLSFPPKTTIA